MRKASVKAFWMLESEHGWKIVKLMHGAAPSKGQDHEDCNYVVIADKLDYEEARDMLKRLGS